MACQLAAASLLVSDVLPISPVCPTVNCYHVGGLVAVAVLLTLGRMAGAVTVDWGTRFYAHDLLTKLTGFTVYKVVYSFAPQVSTLAHHFFFQPVNIVFF